MSLARSRPARATQRHVSYGSDSKVSSNYAWLTNRFFYVYFYILISNTVVEPRAYSWPCWSLRRPLLRRDLPCRSLSPKLTQSAFRQDFLYIPGCLRLGSFFRSLPSAELANSITSAGARRTIPGRGCSGARGARLLQRPDRSLAIGSELASPGAAHRSRRLADSSG